jgi:hypothetical protein
VALALLLALSLSPAALAKKKKGSSSSSSSSKTYSSTPNCDLSGYNAAIATDATSEAKCTTCMKAYQCKDPTHALLGTSGRENYGPCDFTHRDPCDEHNQVHDLREGRKPIHILHHIHRLDVYVGLTAPAVNGSIVLVLAMRLKTVLSWSLSLCGQAPGVSQTPRVGWANVSPIPK